MTPAEQELDQELEELNNQVHSRLEENLLLKQIADARATLRINLVENRVTDPATLDALRDSVARCAETYRDKKSKIGRNARRPNP